MAFSMYMNMPGIQFGYGPALDAPGYPHEDVPMDVGPFWDPNHDPSLRESPNPMAFYHPEWQAPEQQPLTRLLGEPEKFLFAAAHLPSFAGPAFQRDLNRPHEATRPIPPAYELVRDPPSSICSTAPSPGTDTEWYPDGYAHQQAREEFALARSVPQSQGLPDLEWRSRTLSPPQVPGHINPSEVLVFPDPEEVTFKDDEVCYMDEVRMDFAMEVVDSRTIKEEPRREDSCGRARNDGRGRSLPGGGSPAPLGGEAAEDDVDAEGEEVNELDEAIHDVADPRAGGVGDEDEDEDEPGEEDAEDPDTDYKPEGARPKRRRSSRASPASPASKKGRVAKAAPRRSQFQCRTCDHYAKDAVGLVRHIAAAHTRPYVCTFSFAGCPSTFGNKNEWKRHVTSQHLCLQYWLCNVAACAHTKPSPVAKSTGANRAKAGGNEFNRKDLFTQHLKRMHAPFAVKRQNKKNAEWDERVKVLQASCLKVRRDPPHKTKCPIRSCGKMFEGPNSWDERMEHVGRHLEKAALPANGDVAHEVIDQESDEFMIQWALRERIIERRGSNAYKLCGDAGAAEEDGGDADAEDE